MRARRCAHAQPSSSSSSCSSFSLPLGTCNLPCDLAQVATREDELRTLQRSMGSKLTTLTERLTRLKDTSKQERAALVQTTLHSLQQLAQYLAASLAGLRISSPELPPPRMRSKHRWGALTREDELETMVVRVSSSSSHLAALLLIPP